MLSKMMILLLPGVHGFRALIAAEDDPIQNAIQTPIPDLQEPDPETVSSEGRIHWLQDTIAAFLKIENADVARDTIFPLLHQCCENWKYSGQKDIFQLLLSLNRVAPSVYDLDDGTDITSIRRKLGHDGKSRKKRRRV